MTVSTHHLGTSSTARYLALGDSYTIGERVAPDQRWTHQAVALLRESGMAIDLPHTIARTGWTAAELADAIAAAGHNAQYDLVSLLIGVNNQYRGETPEKFREEFKPLLNTAVGFARGSAGRVVVLSIPDWGVTPFADQHDRLQIAREIDQFNAVAQDICKAAGVTFVDITTPSREAAHDPQLVADDQLHFSGKMYRIWAEAVTPAMRRILSSR